MHVISHVCQPYGDGSSHRGFPYTTFAHQHNQAMFTRAISSTVSESDKFSGVYRTFVTGSGIASKRVSSSPFNADTPTIFTGWSNKVSLGSSDKPAGRFASASCSRCHIAAASASCSASALGSTPLITVYWFFRPIVASSSWVRATSCSVDFAVVQPEPCGYVQDRTTPLPHEHTAHAAFPARPLGQDRKHHPDYFQ